jgi:hypothetical protein
VRGLRCLALVAAYNEADIIDAFLTHCAEQGIPVYLMDNRSTDATLERALAHEGGALVGWEDFPGRHPGRYELEHVLRRKEALVRELDADWFLQLDVDELVEPLERGRRFADLLDDVDAAGCDAIRFRVLEFLPEPGFRFPDGGDPRALLTRWRPPGHASYDLRTTAFRPVGRAVDLTTSGGHEAAFPGRRVYPPRQLLRHYPLRDAEHAARKVFRERQPRWGRERRRNQWHVHYDHLRTSADIDRALAAAAASSRPFDDDARRLLAELNLEELARESLALRDELALAEAEKPGRVGELPALAAAAAEWRRTSPLAGRLERSFWRARRRALAAVRGPG